MNLLLVDDIANNRKLLRVTDVKVTLRRETTTMLAWNAERLRMGTQTHLVRLRCWEGRGRELEKHDTFD